MSALSSGDGSSAFWGAAEDGHLIERGRARRLLVKGSFLHVLQDDVELPNGLQVTREFVRHPGAAMVIALLDDGRLLLERQFRYPVGRVMIEFPAGKRDADEASLHCAQRELLEETGYVAAEWAYAGVLHPVISYATEQIDIWFARGLTPGVARPDPGELLDVVSLSPEELLQACLSGAVTDAKTLTGMLWVQNVLSGRHFLSWSGADPASHRTPPSVTVPLIA